MTKRPWWTTMDGIGAGVLLAAVLGAWQASRMADVQDAGEDAATLRPSGATAGHAGRGAGQAPGRSGAVAARPRPAPAPLGGLPEAAPFVDRGAAGPDWSGPVAWGLPPRETEVEAAERLAEGYRKLVSDLEYTRGLREPLQQRVAPAPEPWRSDEQAADHTPPALESVSPSAAPAAGGAEVILRGRNLRAARVMFGAAAARISRLAENEVRVVVPPGSPGTVRIALTNADGHFALAPEPFTLLP